MLTFYRRENRKVDSSLTTTTKLLPHVCLDANGYIDFINDCLANAPDHFHADVPEGTLAEVIVVNYIRFLESQPVRRVRRTQ